MGNGRPKIDVNCQDYRKTMELLGLKRQIEEGVPDPQKRTEILERIDALEKDLAMD